MASQKEIVQSDGEVFPNIAQALLRFESTITTLGMAGITEVRAFIGDESDVIVRPVIILDRLHAS